MIYAHRVVIAFLLSASMVLAGGELGGPPDAGATCRSRGETYRAALAAKAAAERLATLREARERAERYEARQVAYFSRLYGPRVGEWYPLVHRYFPGYESRALYVMRGESGGCRHADNGVCRGLYQLHSCHAAAFRRVTGRPYYWDVFNAEANVKFAAHMSNGGRNWSAWSVRPPF